MNTSQNYLFDYTKKCSQSCKKDGTIVEDMTAASAKNASNEHITPRCQVGESTQVDWLRGIFVNLFRHRKQTKSTGVPMFDQDQLEGILRDVKKNV